MRLLLDTNVLLDVYLKRPLGLAEAQIIWRNHVQKKLTAYLTATTITNLFYVFNRAKGKEVARVAVRNCLDTFPICGVNGSVLNMAHQFNGKDFEDDLQIACAVAYRLEAIVTRDRTGFKQANMLVLTPVELITRLKLKG